jgi:hypothetical protein
MVNGWLGAERRAENYPRNWGTITQQVLQRDKRTCKIQGENCIGLATEVHHKDNRRNSQGQLNHSPNNLVAICSVCHAHITGLQGKAGNLVSNPRQEPVSPGYLDGEVTPVEIKDRSTWIKKIGPTWERKDGEYILPKNTLGWHVIKWVMENLLLNGVPFIPTGEQARFILWWYAIDENGKWVYEEGLKVAPKGWGKDPLASLLLAVEFIGPCRFAGWSVSATGIKTPKVKDEPKAWCQLAALNLTQTQITFEYLKDIFSDKLIKKFGIVHNAEIIYASNRSRKIEALSANSRSKEGQFPTFAIGSEYEHWLANNGMHRLYRVIGRNISKVPNARIVGITNAPNPGEDSIALRKIEAKLDQDSGRTKDTKMMLDFNHATEFAQYKDWADRIWVLNELYGDSIKFTPIEKIANVFDDVTLPMSETLAFYFNSIALGAEIWVDIRKWDACGVDVDFNKINKIKQKIVLAGDGSLKDDSTALVAIIIGGEFDGIVFEVGVWERPSNLKRGEVWNVPREEVSAKVDEMFFKYNVVAFYFDPSHKKDDSDIAFWGPYVDRWSAQYGKRVNRVLWATTVNPFNFDMANTPRVAGLNPKQIKL